MKSKRKVIIIFILVAMVISIASVGVYYWYNATYFVYTEDAKVDADLFKVNSQMSGKLLDFNIKEGGAVDKEQILGRQETSGQADSNFDTSIIRSPIKGIIIKKSANAGEILTSGQTVAYVIDPSKIYITANIEETKLNKLKEDQKVEITIDKYDDKQFTGKVESIGEASNSEFSLLPTASSASFTKVVQKVPVKIKLDDCSNMKILPGTNAIVNIHIK